MLQRYKRKPPRPPWGRKKLPPTGKESLQLRSAFLSRLVDWLVSLNHWLVPPRTDSARYPRRRGWN